jgi:hypothetical protein
MSVPDPQRPLRTADSFVLEPGRTSRPNQEFRVSVRSLESITVTNMVVDPAIIRILLDEDAAASAIQPYEQELAGILSRRAEREVAAPATADAALSKQFQQRRDEWIAATRAMSSITKATTHRTYLRLIALGPSVIPLLIADLQKHPNRNWHTALCILTDTNPIRPEDAGNAGTIAAAWKQWQENENREHR